MDESFADGFFVVRSLPWHHRKNDFRRVCSPFRTSAVFAQSHVERYSIKCSDVMSSRLMSPFRSRNSTRRSIERLFFEIVFPFKPCCSLFAT